MSSNDPARWFPFEHLERWDFKDEPVVACYLGKLFHFWRGRNAYWGRWSSRYPGHESFCPDLARAKSKIETRRTQGSQWTIGELPVVVISGREDSLIVGEINTDEPLSTFLRSRRRLVSLEQFGHHFNPRRPDSVVRIICRSGDIPAAQLPFQWHRSVSHGGNYLLGWRTSIAESSLVEPPLRLVLRINKSLQREAHRTHH